MPIGPMKSPAIRPSVAPIVPALLPPDFLVASTGKMLSSTETNTAATAQIISTGSEMLQRLEKKARRSPAHASGAPGITGTNVPKKPISSRSPAPTASRMSIIMRLFYHESAFRKSQKLQFLFNLQEQSLINNICTNGVIRGLFSQQLVLREKHVQRKAPLLRSKIGNLCKRLLFVDNSGLLGEKRTRLRAEVLVFTNKVPALLKVSKPYLIV